MIFFISGILSIGFYLNQNRIKYHAVEDGLNCLLQSNQISVEPKKQQQLLLLIANTFLSFRLSTSLL